jgi:hypothetical protein
MKAERVVFPEEIQEFINWATCHQNMLEEYYSCAIEGASKTTLAHTKGCIQTMQEVLIKLEVLAKKRVLQVNNFNR